jgi:hypothetical protein
MTEDKQRGLTWPQIRYWLISLALIGIGVAATIWGGPWEASRPILKELGPGIFTAGILAALVEPFFRKEFARDAFLAAFRYVLPDELKEEMRRTIGYKFLCTSSVSIITITELPDDLVRVQIKHERIFKNITDHAEPFFASLGLDEWGFNEKSQIEECYLVLEDGTRKDGGDHPEYPASRKDAIGRKSDAVNVRSGATVKVVSKGTEIHRNNGEAHMEFGNPSINPVVRVEAPETLQVWCSFGIPHGKVTVSNITKEYTLQGTQFPGQRSRVRWWRDQLGRAK